MRKYSLIGLALLIVLGSCKVRSLDFVEVKNFKVQKMGLSSSQVALDIRCYNPNKFGMKLTGLSSDVYIDSQFIGKATFDSTLRIPKLDTFLLPVKMDMKMGPAVVGLFKVFTGYTDSINVRLGFTGKAKLKKSLFRINYPISYEGIKTIKL